MSSFKSIWLVMKLGEASLGLALSHYAVDKNQARLRDSTMSRACARTDIFFLKLLLHFWGVFYKDSLVYRAELFALVTNAVINSLQSFISQNSRLFAVVPLDIVLWKFCLTNKKCIALDGSIENPVRDPYSNLMTFWTINNSCKSEIVRPTSWFSILAVFISWLVLKGIGLT